jgi:tRNA nucleotidyltransferase (CCA-adding enzyme)
MPSWQNAIAIFSYHMSPKSPSPLSSQNWPFDLTDLPKPAYLVGGAVRDAWLQRSVAHLDLDFVLPQKAVKTARQIANRYGGGYVLLDAERQIARVVFDRATVDFAAQEGQTLTEDLQRRDFTINAIAYNPHHQTTIDPLQGQQDLQKQVVRMVSPKNLESDPLRLLRAYRQAAQLDFSIDPTTQKTIQELASLIARVAAERVRTEISYILETSHGAFWLQQAWQDGVLSVWFPSCDAGSFQLMAGCDRAFDTIISEYGEFRPLTDQLQQPLRSTLPTTWLMLAKLFCLLDSDPETATKQLLDLKYSNIEQKNAIALKNTFPQLASTEAIEQQTIRDWFFLYKTVGEAFASLVVLALANNVPITALEPPIRRYLDPENPVAHPQPILSGEDFIHELQFPKGPEIGRWLQEVQIARAEGKVNNREQALAWVARQVSG